MSATDEAGGSASRASLWLRQVEANARGTFATLMRSPQPPNRALWWPSRALAVAAALLAVCAIAAFMAWLDGWAAVHVQTWPRWLVDPFQRLTHWGRSGWFLWPTGLFLVAMALCVTPAIPRYARAVLAAISVRVGFVFLAIAVPGLLFTILKRLIGRARPLVEGSTVWTYQPFGWKVEYASFPSGHATTSFSVLVALGALFPEARAILWPYAVLVAMSRVVVNAHYPSDVIAGAIVGSLGAWLVLRWFASRKLGFVVGSDGMVRRLPGPRGHRIKAVARRLVSA